MVQMKEKEQKGKEKREKGNEEEADGAGKGKWEAQLKNTSALGLNPKPPLLP